MARITSFFSALAFLFLPVFAHAAVPPEVRCDGLPGCGSSTFNSLATVGIPLLTDVFLRAAAALAVIAVLWGGLTLVLARGDEGKVDKAKNSVLFGLGGLALAMSANTLVSLLVTENFGQTQGADFLFGSAGFFAAAVRIGFVFLHTVLIFMVLYAGIKLVMARGKTDEKGKAINIIKWAIVGAILANLARVIVRAFVYLPFPG